MANLSDYNRLNAAINALVKGAALLGEGELSLKPGAKIPAGDLSAFAAGERELNALSESDFNAYLGEIERGEGETALSENCLAVEAIFSEITGDAGASDGALYRALIA